MRYFKCLSVPKTWRFIALFSRLLCCVRGVKFLRLLVALGCIGSGQFVFAQDYYWKILNYPQMGTFSSHVSAAQAFVSTRDAHYSLTSKTERNAYYRIMRNSDNGGIGNIQVERSGTGCTLPAIYNSETGECEAPEPDKCEPTIGQRKSHYHNFGTLGENANEAPITVCENSCQYSNTFETPECNREFPNQAFCSLTYLGNGVQCTEGDSSNPSNFDQPPTKPPIALDPTLTKDIQCSDWVTNPDGTGSRSCTNVSEYKDPGKINCPPGTSGTVVCSPGTPAPDYKKEDVSTTERKKKNPDGSSQSDTTKTTTTTVCKGTQPCVTTTKTEGDSTGTNPDGTPGDTSSTCTGSGCKPSTEEKPEEEEEEKSTVSGDGSCPAVPACTGDAIACAILRQTHQQRCNDEEFRKVDEQKIIELKSTLNSEFSGPDYQEIKPTADSTYSLANMIDTSSRFSSSCPVFPIVSYPWITGVTNTLDLNSPGLCVFLSLMGFLNVAFAMRFAAEIIARGLS